MHIEVMIYKYGNDGMDFQRSVWEVVCERTHLTCKERCYKICRSVQRAYQFVRLESLVMEPGEGVKHKDLRPEPERVQISKEVLMQVEKAGLMKLLWQFEGYDWEVAKQNG